MKAAQEGVFKPSRIIPSDVPTKARLKAVGESLKGKDILAKSNKHAESMLKAIREIPNPR